MRRGVEACPARPGWQSAAARLAKPLLDQTSDWWRRRLVAGGVDATGLLSGRDLLVLAPHPDDETLGAGAAVARARAAGNRVTVAVATDGRHSTASGPLSPQRLGEVRSAELHAACRTLGVPDDDVIQLGYEDGTLAARWPEIADRLTGLLDERSPDVVFVPCAKDDHPDHQAVHQALLAALSGLPRVPLILAYPIWTWAQAPWFVSASGRRLPLLAWAARQLVAGRWLWLPAAQFLPAKRAALAEYVSQTTNLTGEPTWSYLSAEFCSLFLRPVEVFLPVAGPVPGARRRGGVRNQLYHTLINGPLKVPTARVLRAVNVRRLGMTGSVDYWERNYATGGTSGEGSYGPLADFKARILNSFVAEHDVRSVIELGCGRQPAQPGQLPRLHRCRYRRERGATVPRPVRRRPHQAFPARPVARAGEPAGRRPRDQPRRDLPPAGGRHLPGVHDPAVRRRRPLPDHLLQRQGRTAGMGRGPAPQVQPVDPGEPARPHPDREDPQSVPVRPDHSVDVVLGLLRLREAAGGVLTAVG